MSVENDRGKDCQDDRDRGKADAACGAAAERAFFAASVEQHDDKGEKHHDRAGIDDDLRGSKELCAEQEIEHRQRSHHDNQRQGAVDGMCLEQEIDGPCEAESGKNEKQNQMHRDLMFKCAGESRQFVDCENSLIRRKFRKVLSDCK